MIRIELNCKALGLNEPVKMKAKMNFEAAKQLVDRRINAIPIERQSIYARPFDNCAVLGQLDALVVSP